MDPTNNQPAQPTATGPVAPAPVEAPVSSTTPQQAPVAPAQPVAPTVATSGTVNADVQNAALNPPVNPVITPGTNPAAQVAGAGGTMSMNQMFQTQPAQAGGVIDETTAIAVPEGPKPPDPVEEELKAPLKATGPVPGSIGSAVSMPPADGSAPQTNGVSEQMVANGVNPMATNANTPAGKKQTFFDKLATKTKMTKNTLILFTVLAGVIVVALIVILIMLIAGVL